MEGDAPQIKEVKEERERRKIIENKTKKLRTNVFRVETNQPRSDRRVVFHVPSLVLGRALRLL